MKTLIVGSNYLALNFYNSFFEMLGLESEHYTSIPVGMKRISLNADLVNIVILIDNRDDFNNLSRQQHLLDSKSHNIIFICKDEELMNMCSGKGALVFKHLDVIEHLAKPLVKQEICSGSVLGKQKKIKPEDTLKHIQNTLIKNKISLPIKNECAMSMMAILEDDNVSFKTIDKISKSDPVLHSGIIKMANSVYFSGAFTCIIDMEKALVRVGTANVKTYLINYVNKSLASNKDLIFNEEISVCVEKSLLTASLCFAMAETFKVSSPVTMFSIGLMSSMGEIFMYASLSDYFSTIDFDRSSMDDYIKLVRTAGLMIGSKLLQKWKMADDYVLPIANTARLSSNKFMKETRILHLALNMHEYVKTKTMDNDLESALSNTQVQISAAVLEKIDQDAEKHLREIRSILG